MLFRYNEQEVASIEVKEINISLMQVVLYLGQMLVIDGMMVGVIVNVLFDSAKDV